MKDVKSMSKKDRKAILIATAIEVQDICEFEPAIKTDGKAEKDLIPILKEAHAELTPDDKLSEDAVAVFTFLGLIEEVEEAEEEEEAPKKAAKKVRLK